MRQANYSALRMHYVVFTFFVNSGKVYCVFTYLRPNSKPKVIQTRTFKTDFNLYSHICFEIEMHILSFIPEASCYEWYREQKITNIGNGYEMTF